MVILGHRCFARGGPRKALVIRLVNLIRRFVLVLLDFGGVMEYRSTARSPNYIRLGGLSRSLGVVGIGLWSEGARRN
jgi:hypothetical protein